MTMTFGDTSSPVVRKVMQMNEKVAAIKSQVEAAWWDKEVVIDKYQSETSELETEIYEYEAEIYELETEIERCKTEVNEIKDMLHILKHL